MNPLDWSLRSVWGYITGKDSISMMDQIDSEAYRLLNVKGKVVLDVGAYNGDSAKFFLEEGAAFVHCIDIDKRKLKKIKLPNTKLYPEPFSLQHLLIPHHVMKMDIEGAEMILLRYAGELKPSVVEVHSGYLVSLFKEKGWRILAPRPFSNAIMINFDIINAELS